MLVEETEHHVVARRCAQTPFARQFRKLSKIGPQRDVDAPHRCGRHSIFVSRDIRARALHFRVLLGVHELVERKDSGNENAGLCELVEQAVNERVQLVQHWSPPLIDLG